MKVIVRKWPGVENYCVWVGKTLKRCFHGGNARKQADDFATRLERMYANQLREKHKKSSTERYSGLKVQEG